MKPAVVLGIGIVLCSSLVGLAAVEDVSPENTGALTEFIEQLKVCLDIGELEELKTEFVIPAGEYCLYYAVPEPNSNLLYDFGYLPSPEGNDCPRCTCGPLRRLVEGHHEDCSYEPSYPPALLPPDPALLVSIRHGDCEYFHLWVNGDWEYPASPPVLCTSSPILNQWTNPGLAYAYRFTTGNIDCRCACLDDEMEVAPNRTGYLIFWETHCEPKKYEWDDFWVALFPAA